MASNAVLVTASYCVGKFGARTKEKAESIFVVCEKWDVCAWFFV